MRRWFHPRPVGLWLSLCALLACQHGPGQGRPTPTEPTPPTAPAAPPAAPAAAPPSAAPAAPENPARPRVPDAHMPHDHGPRPPGVGEPPIGIFPGAQAPPAGTRVTCPVCGDEFTTDATQPTRRHHGKTLVFCCKRCLPHFDKNPDLFADQE